MAIDEWYLANLVCPIDKSPLTLNGSNLVSQSGRCYPVVDGMPMMLVESVEQTLGVAHGSLNSTADDQTDDPLSKYYLESLGISDDQRQQIKALLDNGPTAIDPVVQMLIAATSGYSYMHLVGNNMLQDYPIPDIPFPQSDSESLLDIGCNWGRWSIAAARKGYRPVGIDPSLGAVMAARRISQDMGLTIRFVVGDGRYLPFRDGTFDNVYSYSVLQHFSPENAEQAIAEAGRTLRSGGSAKIQMAQKWAIRSLQHQLKRGFRAPEKFEVRYYSTRELKKKFERLIGPTKVEVDCFFGLGWQKSDEALLRPAHKTILRASEYLKQTSHYFPPLTMVADSLLCTSAKP